MMSPQTGCGTTEEAIVIGESLDVPLQNPKKKKKIFFVLLWVVAGISRDSNL